LACKRFVVDNRCMVLETFPVGPLQCNCTIVGDEVTREATVIDPGDEIADILARLGISTMWVGRRS
jgi:glyoxylase-like metal-dependent hydrolase (beta-lactamase superfamily II)